jgi:uncharacterized repeat protein (TIGR03803 family)
MRNFITSIVISTFVVLAFTAALTRSVQAQTFTLIHTFTGRGDGANPYAGLTMDAAGNLYGTTAQGGGKGCGGNGCGTVFKLSHKGSDWVLTPLYSFAGGYDGAEPYAGVILASNGSLYGTTGSGGGSGCSSNGCGTVFSLRPAAHACPNVLCPWTETVVDRFEGGNDGEFPYSELTEDQSGNLYGTCIEGRSWGFGTVFQLTLSNGIWVENTLYAFQGLSDGKIPSPYAGLIFDSSGNLYGTTLYGSNGYGSVYELSPSNGGWALTTLYGFSGNDGNQPYGGVTFDNAGHLYGTTYWGGSYNYGVVFELTPNPNGSWMYTSLYDFTGGGNGVGGPVATLAWDAAGNLYGTTQKDGAYGAGNVFKLAPSNGGWVYTDLYDFTGGNDGAFPYSKLVLDVNGNLYGTTYQGGTYNQGVVWQITP